MIEPEQPLPRVAILGAGNGGRAMAGHLCLLGFDVVLFNRDDPLEVEQYLDPIARAGCIRLTGDLEGEVAGVRVTTDVGEAVRDADIIFVVTPALAHATLAQQMAPWTRPDQVVVLTPGRTFGAYEVLSTMRAHGAAREITVAETYSLPYACRLTEGNGVFVSRVKSWLPIAALPARGIDRVTTLLRPIFPSLEPLETTLHTGLLNLGAIFHPAGTLLNAARIERLGGGFPFYTEAITPSVGRVLESADAERVAIGAALGVVTATALETTSRAYGVRAGSLPEALQANPAYVLGHTPGDLSHRYVQEDVPMGLVPLASLGRQVGARTRTLDAVVHLASVMTGQNFWDSRRTMERLGLADLDATGLRDAFTRGEPQPR